MRHPRITITLVAVAVAAAVGGIAVAATASSSSPSYSSANGPLSVTGGTPGTANAATVQTAMAVVQGKPEMILEDSTGQPLYTYQPDTATTSHVTGHLAVLWPPLTAQSPTSAGTTGRLQSLMTSNGQQVSYNGHFLYTFVEDSPGHVTGQGVQSFYVATPGLAAQGAATAPAAQPSTAGNGYGYGSGY